LDLGRRYAPTDNERRDQRRAGRGRQMLPDHWPPAPVAADRPGRSLRQGLRVGSRPFRFLRQYLYVEMEKEDTTQGVIPAHHSGARLRAAAEPRLERLPRIRLEGLLRQIR